MATRSPAKAQSRASTSSRAARFQRQAEATVEHLDALKGDYPERKLVRSALLEILAYIQEARGQRRELTNLFERAENLLREAEGFIHQAEEEEASSAEVIEIGERRGDQEVEVPPPETWDDKFNKVKLKAKEDGRKHKKRRNKATRRREALTHTDTSHERRVFLCLTVASVIAAIVFATGTMVLMYLATLNDQQINFAAPGASLALTGVMSLTATLSERSRRLAVAAANPKTNKKPSKKKPRKAKG